MGFFDFLTEEIAIDLGTANTLIIHKDKVVVDSPSIVARDLSSNKIIAVGKEAQLMQGKTYERIKTVRPLKDGVIADFDASEQMINAFIRSIPPLKRRFFSPSLKIVVCIPSGITEVEMRAVRESCERVNGKEIFLIYEPMAAAIGIGLDIMQAKGNMIIDIGGGTADIAVIALGGPVVSESIKIAGDDFDEAILRYMRKKHNLLIGERTAEDIKVNIGCASKRPENVTMEVRGRNLVTALPKTVVVSSDEIMDALVEPASMIVNAVHNVLERTPPELAADIYERGIVMTGGGALLYGLDKLMQEKTGITTMLAEDPLTAVAIGTGKSIDMAGEDDDF
mgnify:CR=1 FL=1